MSIEIWLAFVTAAAVLLVIPGPTILAVISYSIAHGRRAKLPLVAAVALGDSTALVVSLLGLGALLASSAFWFTAVKWAGGVYLLYLGIRLLRAGMSPVEAAAPSVPGSRWKLFANTYLVTALNPKGIVFFVAFLPQFLDLTKPLLGQMVIFELTFLIVATLNAGFYALAASGARATIRKPGIQRAVNRVGGSIIIAMGLATAAARRANA